MVHSYKHSPLHNLILRSIIAFILLAMNFVMFTSAGNYFSYKGDIPTEFILVLFLLLFLTSLIMFLLSFSALLQNIFVALIAVFFVLSFFKQFALFDETTIFSDLLIKFADPLTALKYANSSHYIIAFFTGLLLFFLMVYANKKTVLIFITCLLASFATLTYYQSTHALNRGMNVVNYEHRNLPSNNNSSIFILINIPNLGSYANLQDLLPDENSAKQKAVSNLFSFFAKNNFTLYSKAYVTEEDANTNLINLLNYSSDKDVKDHIYKPQKLSQYWDFNNKKHRSFSLQNNELLEKLNRLHIYNTIYENSDIELCHLQDKQLADKCIMLQPAPNKLSPRYLNVFKRTMLLIAQWIYHSGVNINLEQAYNLVNFATNAENIPFLGINVSNLDAFASLNVLDHLANDIIENKSDRAYIVNLNTLSNLYIYDEFCNIKPMSQWKNQTNNPWVSDVNMYLRRQAYLEQLSCLSGKLHNFIQTLEANNITDKANIIITGSSGLGSFHNKLNRSFVEKFKADNLVAMAIKTPKNKQFSMINDLCSTVGIMRGFMNKTNQCGTTTPNSSAENMQNLYTELNNSNLAQNVLRILTANFDEWYPKWFANNEDKNPYTAEKKENRKLNSILSDNQNIGTILTISEIPQSTSRIDTKENLLPSMIPNVYTGRPTAKGKFAPQTGKNALGMQ